MFFCDCILLAVFPEMALSQEENEQVMKEDTDFTLTSYKTTRWTSLHPSVTNKQAKQCKTFRWRDGSPARNILFLERTWVSTPTSVGSQTSITSVPGDMMPSSGLWRHLCAHGHEQN